MTNLLRKAAENPDVDVAAKLVRDALGITDSETAARLLPTAYRWRAFSVEGRLSELASWLHAECFEQMDLVEQAPIGGAKYAHQND